MRNFQLGIVLSDFASCGQEAHAPTELAILAHDASVGIISGLVVIRYERDTEFPASSELKVCDAMLTGALHFSVM